MRLRRKGQGGYRREKRAVMTHNPSLTERAAWRDQAEPTLPVGANELPELRSVDVSHRLGYFGNERFVIFGFCCGGGEVIWKDHRSYGFGTGGWKLLFDELAPLAARYGATLGGMAGPGSHVLMAGRLHGMVYTVARNCAEQFLAAVCGNAPPARRCLCALNGLRASPVRGAQIVSYQPVPKHKVRAGKGDKDRMVMLPARLREQLELQVRQLPAQARATEGHCQRLPVVPELADGGLVRRGVAAVSGGHRPAQGVRGLEVWQFRVVPWSRHASSPSPSGGKILRLTGVSIGLGETMAPRAPHVPSQLVCLMPCVGGGSQLVDAISLFCFALLELFLRLLLHNRLLPLTVIILSPALLRLFRLPARNPITASFVNKVQHHRIQSVLDATFGCIRG